MNTLGWDELVAFLQQAQIRRMLWQGLWEPEAGQRQFHVMYEPVFLDSDLGLLKIATIINHSYLTFEPVEEPSWDMFEEAGEADNAGLVDLSYGYFGDRTVVQCHELRCAYVTHPEPAAELGQIAMASMAFDGGQLVTFNPWHFSGLRVQGGVHLESVMAPYDYLTARTEVRVWTR